jgi:hypothetical protein
MSRTGSCAKPCDSSLARLLSSLSSVTISLPWRRNANAAEPQPAGTGEGGREEVGGFVRNGRSENQWGQRVGVRLRCVRLDVGCLLTHPPTCAPLWWRCRISTETAPPETAIIVTAERGVCIYLEFEKLDVHQASLDSVVVSSRAF